MPWPADHGPRVGSARDVFVFAGAGVSASLPAGLPVFAALRDEILRQLDLEHYCPPQQDPARTDPPRPSEQQRVALGLAPEPFMLALRRAGIEIVPWLHRTLSTGKSNAAHDALAQLAAGGAAVWTVNFDTLIEEASGGKLMVSAWPDDPADTAALLKPHGTVTGQVIVDSEQVLRPLGRDWESRLRADVRGRTVVFVGYSGRDLDFQPIWDSVLSEAREVVWFDFADPDDEARRAAIVRRVAGSGRLRFPRWPPPSPGARANPSADFVRWCQANGLVMVSDNLLGQLSERRPDGYRYPYPRLEGDRTYGTIEIQHVVGDVAGARSTCWALIRRGPDRRRAARALLATTLNHGGRPVSVALAAAALVPPLGAGRQVRALARRKRATILSNLGRHHAVRRLTDRLDPADVSTLLVLRAAALRMTGSLDDAADAAGEAMVRAAAEQHPVRLAHAAFQRGLALQWAYRLDEAAEHLQSRQRPLAEIAATRWVAWADFVDAGLAIHRAAGDTAIRLVHANKALELIVAGGARFKAEGLVDGQIDMETIRLTALRLAGDDAGYRTTRVKLADMLEDRPTAGRRYARGHRFTREAVALEDAEFARVHEVDLAEAERLYRFVACSDFPIHAALGNLGLAFVEVQRGLVPEHATAAVALGRAVAARLVVDKGERLLRDGPDGRAAPEELFVP
jgi:hypothetical protein